MSGRFLGWLDLRPSLHRKVKPRTAPQRQCKQRGDHTAHLYEDDGYLIWSCQGRGSKPTP